MKILVLIKEVPDMAKVKFDSEKGTVNRKSATAEINPFDESALQCAIDLKETIDAEVVALTMGPPGAMNTLRDVYARGADDCILISDRAFGGSDTLATATALSEGAKKAGFDLILCGEKSVDGDTAQVGAEVAEMLGIPHCYYADKVELSDTQVTVEIENLGGKKQIRSMNLPALVGVTKNCAKLKLPTVNAKLNSLENEFLKLTMDDFNDITAEDVGFKGSPTKVSKIEVPGECQREAVILDGKEQLDDFMTMLVSEAEKRGVL
ncbi:MAG: electron transfer flavoprotein subunit beta/FixA family protein [Eubacteriaceae bacterium]|nr:electron transfer flavoprotein subunit beta/FixA family protein [Eubacteriaceae bacterium]